MNTNTRIEDAVALYYFDFDLRNILNRYLSHIEVAIRTTMIYELSNKYNNNPLWFVDPAVVKASFITDFPNKVYKTIKEKDVIKRHHRRYPTDVYAPAWKTMEFMVFGNLTTLYNSLLLNDDKRLVSHCHGVTQTNVFFDYIEAVRLVRMFVLMGMYFLTLTYTLLLVMALQADLQEQCDTIWAWYLKSLNFC